MVSSVAAMIGRQIMAGAPTRWRRAAQLLLLCYVLSALLLVLLGIPAAFAALRTPCEGGYPACLSAQLSLADVQALTARGFPLAIYATAILTLQLATVAVIFTLATLVIRRRSGDPVALLVACSWIALATTVAIGPDVLAREWTVVAWMSRTAWFIQGATLVPTFCLFPDGRFVPRWTRWAVLGSVALNLAIFLAPQQFAFGTPLQRVAAIANIGDFFVIAVAQLYRYRRIASEAQRRQLKWVVFGIALLTTVMVGLRLVNLFALDATRPGTPGNGLLNAIGVVGILTSVMTFAVAILRDRLFEIDLLINRALVYGGLTAAVAGFYATLIGGLGMIFGSRGNAVVAAIAAGVIAVIFAPLRDRLQRGVDHLLYGERGEPYAILTRLGRQLEGTIAPAIALPAIVATVRAALKLPYVAIALRRDDTATIAAASGKAVEVGMRLPLVVGQETVGELLLAPRAPGEQFDQGDRRLLADLARQIGVATQTIRLHEETTRLNADLRRSRERLVATREEERRRLRRDLHDGLGPVLGALTLKLDVADDLLDRDPDAARALLRSLRTQVQGAVAEIRRLVYALRPPALDELGLVSALRQLAGGYGTSAPQISVTAPEPLAPLPAAVEVAAYRITQEAVTNVFRHAGARTCTIALTLSTQALLLEITDDGCGIDSASRRGIGLASMRERAEEIGGVCAIGAATGGGTRIRATLPLAPAPEDSQ